MVGSGPAGLTAAGELVEWDTTSRFMRPSTNPAACWCMASGISPAQKDCPQEVQRLQSAGVKIECNMVIGRTYTLPELRERFDAVFIANGAGLPVFMNVPGENLKGVYSANEYLTRVNLMAAYQFPNTDTPVLHGKCVAVVGGGNVAMDSVRTAKRLGAASAMIVYRRTKKELPARAEEVHHAEEEGIQFEFLTAPVEVMGNDKRWVTGLKCIRMELGEPDASGRARPVPVPGSEFVIPCDIVVVAIGTRANPLLTASCPELKLNKWGNIVVDDDGMTSLPVCSPAATLSAARPPSSSPWATANARHNFFDSPGLVLTHNKAAAFSGTHRVHKKCPRRLMQLQKSFGRHLSAWYSPRRAFGPGSQSENLVTGPPHFRHFPAGKVFLQINVARMTLRQKAAGRKEYHLAGGNLFHRLHQTPTVLLSKMFK